MNTTAGAQIGTSEWNLTGIGHLGGDCGHCGRNLKHTYDVRNRVTGETITVGRACCKKVTGWTLAAAEATRLLWFAEKTIVRAANWALFSEAEPELAAKLDKAYASDSERKAEHSAAYAVKFAISDNNCWRPADEARRILALGRYSHL